MGGDEAGTLLVQLILLTHNEAAGPPDEVRALLQGRERVLQASHTWWCFLHCLQAPALYAGDCLEARGDDGGADDYALASLERWPNGSSIVRSAHLARRSRVAARRGDRSAAVGFALAAAQVAMEEYVFLMAVLAGRECGGEEGGIFVQDACDQMGRPPEVVIQELAQVRREGP